MQKDQKHLGPDDQAVEQRGVNGSDPTCLEQALKECQERCGELSSKLATVQANVRKRIAEELHDEVSWRFTALNFDLDWVVRHVNDLLDPEHRKRFLERLSRMPEAVRQAHEAIRNTVLLPSPPELSAGLFAAIRDRTRFIQERTRWTVDLALPDKEWPLSGWARLALFRTCQEALANAARHARAKRVRVSMRREDDAIVLEVQDDGVGVNGEHARNAMSFGLSGMQERAGHAGGSVTIEPATPTGTRVLVRIPYGANCE